MSSGAASVDSHGTSDESCNSVLNFTDAAISISRERSRNGAPPSLLETPLATGYIARSNIRKGHIDRRKAAFIVYQNINAEKGMYGSAWRISSTVPHLGNT